MKNLLPKPKNQEFLDEYIALIESAKNVSTNLRTETHHILPRSMGGSNHKSNLISLTTEQHYEAHYLLWKAYSNRQMSAAFHLMTTNKSSRRKLTIDEFVKLREDYKNARKEYWATLTEDQKEHHRKNSNPWANKSESEKEEYKKKCDSWANKSEEEINEIKTRKRLTWDEKVHCDKYESSEIKRINSYKETVSKRTPEERAKLNYNGSTTIKGTIWINDGTNNKRHKSVDGAIPVGWIKGRINKKLGS